MFRLEKNSGLAALAALTLGVSGAQAQQPPSTDGTWKFDFGSGSVVPGYRAVRATLFTAPKPASVSRTTHKSRFSATQEPIRPGAMV